jgi:hypothetical protein
LVSEVLDELIVDVADPGFEFDGYVLIEEVYAVFLLEQRFDFDQIFAFNSAQDGYFLHDLAAGFGGQGVDLAHQYFGVRGDRFLVLSEGVVFVHDDYDLSGHGLKRY